MRLTERWALAGVVLGALLTGCIPAPRTVAVDPPPTMAAAAKVDAGATLTGVLTYRQRVALSKAAVAKIWLQDISRPNLPVPEILDEQVIEPAGQVPIASFASEIDPAWRWRGACPVHVQRYPRRACAPISTGRSCSSATQKWSGWRAAGTGVPA